MKKLNRQIFGLGNISEPFERMRNKSFYVGFCDLIGIPFGHDPWFDAGEHGKV